MIEESQKKTCTQCGHEKLLLTQFYRTKNGKDGYMKMCKDCYSANRQESIQQGRIERERLQREWEERKKQEKEMEARRVLLAEKAQQDEKHRQEEQAFLAAWFAEQPPRKCISCHETKAAVEFGYSEMEIHANEYWIPAGLHRRCQPCHESYFEQYRKPCVVCQRGIKQPMSSFEGYSLSSRDTRINICCQSCEAAFLALPMHQQLFYFRARVNALFPASQQIYAEVDPISQQVRYIGRSGRAKRRHSDHKRNVHQERHAFSVYDRRTKQYIETAWTSRANWMFDLQQQGLEAKQHILLTVQPAIYVVEYERRYILHAIQQGWPLVNTEAFLEQKAQSSTLAFLQAPFEELVNAGWFSDRGIEAFIRTYVH